MKNFRIEVHYNFDIAYDKVLSYNIEARSVKAATGRALALFKKDTPRQRIRRYRIEIFIL